MIIARNWNTIKIPDEVEERIYRKRREYYDRLDLLHKLKGYADDADDWGEELGWSDDAEIEIGDVTLTGKELKEKINDPEWMDDLIEGFEDALESNDSYWESYWMTAEYVIEEAVKEE